MSNVTEARSPDRNGSNENRGAFVGRRVWSTAAPARVASAATYRIDALRSALAGGVPRAGVRVGGARFELAPPRFGYSPSCCLIVSSIWVFMACKLKDAGACIGG
jgi:hypothetical protein